MAISAVEAKRVVKKYYSNLMKILPIDKLVHRLYTSKSCGLLTPWQKSKLDSLTSPEEKVRYFSDKILFPGLDVDFTGHFDEMLTMMKESDDVLVRHLAGKLDVSVAPSTADASLTGTGIVLCVVILVA